MDQDGHEDESRSYGIDLMHGRGSKLTESTGVSGTPKVEVTVILLVMVDVAGGIVLGLVITLTRIEVVMGTIRLTQPTDTGYNAARVDAAEVVATAWRRSSSSSVPRSRCLTAVAL